MKRLINIALTSVAFLALSVTTPFAMAQEDTHKGKPTAGGQMKEAGKETGKAGKSLGSNVKHGRVVRGSKHFSKHLGHAGKNVGEGTVIAGKKVAHTTKKGTKKTVTAVKKATKP